MLKIGSELEKDEELLKNVTADVKSVKTHLPVFVRDYTDFCKSNFCVSGHFDIVESSC